MSVYARFATATPDHLAALQDPRSSIPQGWLVGDEDHCVAELTAYIRDFGITDLVTWGAAPGLAPSLMNASLERFARNVVPRVRAAVEG